MNDAAAPSARVEPVRTLTRLGRMPVQAFLQRHWQRRPLLIRQALPGFQSPFTRESLCELATRDQVESRLVDCAAGRWRLRHGPFRIRSIPSSKRPDWTLLVQGVDLQVQAAAELIARFRFVPDARLDDLMVSYATDGGGVGPHVDSYDVFLLQALGKRRWRIERRPDPACVDGLPIRQLARFQPHEEWVLEPGDLLYLPPGVGHEGVAVGECITCSIGFRTPAWAELAGIWGELQTRDGHGRQAAFRDAPMAASAHPALLPPWMIEQAHRQLMRQRPARRDVALALLRQLSEPKPRVAFERPRKPITQAQLAAAARGRGLVTDRRTRMLYSNRMLAINGELLALPDPEQRRLVKSLADQRVLLVQPGQPLSAATLACLFEWYLAGWVHPYPAPSRSVGFEPGAARRS